MSATTETIATCIRCGYNLYGIADTAPCPECGLLAERSRRLTPQLRDGNPAYLSTLSIGLWLFIAACLLPVGWIVVMVVGAELVDEWSTFRQTPHLYFAGFDLCALLFFVSVYLLTSRDRNDAAPRSSRRLVVRLLALIPLLCMAILHVEVELAPLRWGLRYGGPALAARPVDEMMLALRWILMIAVGLGAIVFPPMFFLHLRDLGRRLLSRQIAEHSVIVGIGISVTAGVLLALYYLDPHIDEMFQATPRREREQLYTYINVIVGTLILLFTLWTAFLLLRLAFAFASEARISRWAWQLADRSNTIQGFEERFSY